jgi:hypothetical protein
MSKFDLEAAKRGEDVQAFLNKAWQDCHFIGVNKSKDAVFIDTYEGLLVFSHDSISLRMKPKQREMWGHPYRLANGSIRMSVLSKDKGTADAAREFSDCACGAVQMILVDEE